MDILNNSEIAFVFWLIVISIFFLSSSKMTKIRNSFKRMLAGLFVRQIISVLFLMVTYMVIIIYWLSELDLWNIEQLKNTVFWCISVGFMSLFQLEKFKMDKSFFKKSVIDNFKLLAIIQFIIGVYTFSLWIEILIVPFLALIITMLAIAEAEKKYYQLKVFLEYSLSLFGVALIVYTLYMLITNFGEFGKEKTLYDFFVPPLLTLCYLPFVFFMLVYTTYQQVFITLKFATKNRFHRYAATFYALILFNFRISLLERWVNEVNRATIKSHSDLVDTFRHIFKIRSSEKNPKEVPKEHGWSPYKAKDFLVKEGLSTGFYNRLFEDEWYALSPMQEFSDGIIPNNIAYYVEGTEGVAKVLKLKVNVNDATRTRQACEKLETMAEALSLSSLNLPLSEDMISAISGCNSYSEKIDDKTITLIVERWSNHKFNGFALKFLISSIEKSDRHNFNS